MKIARGSAVVEIVGAWAELILLRVEEGRGERERERERGGGGGGRGRG